MPGLLKQYAPRKLLRLTQTSRDDIPQDVQEQALKLTKITRVPPTASKHSLSTPYALIVMST